MTAATDPDLGTEYLVCALFICTVDDMKSAIDHTVRFSSGDAEAITTQGISRTRVVLKHLLGLPGALTAV